MTYAIFEVYDYKGGELSASINLSKEELIRQLARVFENKDFEDEDGEPIKKDLESIKEFLNECVSEEDFETTYAGGCGGFCGNIYEIEGDKMEEWGITCYLEEIAQYIFDNWFKDDEEEDDDNDED